MDMLGLKTLTVIHDAVRDDRARAPARRSTWTRSTFDDPAVYELLRQGRTAGVFQFESPLATETLRAMKCDRFDDLVASNALLRPGPLDAGMHTVFIRRKLGQEKVTYPHPVAAGDAGADLRRHHLPGAGDADRQRAGRVHAGRSRRAPEGGGQEGRGADQEGAGQVRRAGDGPGPPAEAGRRAGGARSRPSAATASTSRTRWPTRSCRYQTAWLKAHYPAEFMAALLSSEIGNTDKVVQYINEARELGLEVLPPDVNESGFKFTVVGDRADPLRAGRGAERGRGRDRVDHRRRAQDAPFTRRWPTSSSGSTSGSATSGCSSR